jgi:hypothetical protein
VMEHVLVNGLGFSREHGLGAVAVGGFHGENDGVRGDNISCFQTNNHAYKGVCGWFQYSVWLTS